MPCFKVTAKQPLGFILAIIVIVQVVFVSSFLFGLITVLAQETTETTPPSEEITPPAVTTSPETTLTETTPPTGKTTPPPTETTPATTEPTAPALPTETASTTGETVATDSASSTDSATGTINLEFTNPESGGAATVQVIGAGGSTNGSSETGLTLDDTSTGFSPIILAQWAMNNATTTEGQYIGGDNASTTGAQFLPSGQLNAGKTIAVCAVVADRDGAANLQGAYAKLFYPEGINLPANRTATSGCGQIYDDAFSLKPMTQAEGLELFCNQIKNNDNNLPIFNNNESFDSICAPDGELTYYTAKVYCAERTLAYDDPAGDYKVDINAQDQTGNFSPILTGAFKYLELTAFAVDFNKINYGPVKLNEPKIIAGDLNWQTPIGPNPATIRNVGNTRLQLVIKQNDFGLGKTESAWNISYQARVGENSAFVTYPPEQATKIGQVIDLAELKALDFGIEVYNFPTDTTSAYAGQMTLTADRVEYATCP